jgi:hypothetical protein
MTENGPKPHIEILTFDGCPNREPAIEFVSRVTRERGIDAEVEVIDVPDAEAARQTRFLGSPTIRVDGHDIEPGADARTDYALSCRVFRTDSGASGRPDERWLVDALAHASSGGSS